MLRVFVCAIAKADIKYAKIRWYMYCCHAFICGRYSERKNMVVAVHISGVLLWTIPHVHEILFSSACMCLLTNIFLFQFIKYGIFPPSRSRLTFHIRSKSDYLPSTIEVEQDRAAANGSSGTTEKNCTKN